MVCSILSRFFRLQNLQFKHRCLLCGDPSFHRVCQPCHAYFVSPRSSCKQCGIPLHSVFQEAVIQSAGVQRVESQGERLQEFEQVCGECLSTKPSFDRVFAPYLYQPPLSQLIYDFKQKGQEFVGRALSDMLCDAVNLHYDVHQPSYPDLIVAVPLHWRRQWRRGFNQAETLAHALRSTLNLRSSVKVKRLRHGDSQQLLKRRQRLKNSRGAFVVCESLRGKHVAIIDDVITTGSTVNSLAKALKKAGAAYVSVIALARTPKPLV